MAAPNVKQLGSSGATSGQLLRFNGTNWAPATVLSSPGGSDTQFQFNDAGVLAGIVGLTHNKTAKTITWAPTTPTDTLFTLTGGTLPTTKHAIHITATFPTGGGNQIGSLIQITSAGSASTFQAAHYIDLGAGYTGSGRAHGVYITTAGASTGTSIHDAASGNFSLFASTSSSTTTGYAAGAFLQGGGANVPVVIGSISRGNTEGAGTNRSIGALNFGYSGAGIMIGTYSYTGLTPPLTGLIAAAHRISNGPHAIHIIDAYDDTTNVLRLADTGIFTVSPGGTEGYALSSAGVVYNETGADRDYRVESDTQTHALFLDASLDSGFGRWGFFTSSPDAKVTIDNGASTDPILNLKDGGAIVLTAINGMTGVVLGTGFDRLATGDYSIGGTTINTLSLGRTGKTVAVAGDFSVAETSVFSDHITIADAKNIILNTTTGTKIGTTTSQKLGFYNASPIAQGASVADATGGVVIDSEARTAVNSLISRIESLGLIATV